MADVVYETTEEHFEIFKAECEKWLTFFGLKGWSVIFLHEKLGGEYRASCSVDIAGRIATIRLAIDYSWVPVTCHDVRQSAFHEVCELLLYRLRYIGECRYLQPEEIPEEVHNIIRILENSVFAQSIRRAGP